jgi:hypothetical protein
MFPCVFNQRDSGRVGLDTSVAYKVLTIQSEWTLSNYFSSTLSLGREMYSNRVKTEVEPGLDLLLHLMTSDFGLGFKVLNLQMDK